MTHLSAMAFNLHLLESVILPCFKPGELNQLKLISKLWNKSITAMNQKWKILTMTQSLTHSPGSLDFNQCTNIAYVTFREIESYLQHLEDASSVTFSQNNHHTAFKKITTPKELFSFNKTITTPHSKKSPHQRNSFRLT
eukprot:489337_1